MLKVQKKVTFAQFCRTNLRIVICVTANEKINYNKKEMKQNPPEWKNNCPTPRKTTINSLRAIKRKRKSNVFLDSFRLCVLRTDPNEKKLYVVLENVWQLTEQCVALLERMDIGV